MKKIFFSVPILFFAAIVMVGCGKTSPKDVAREWLTDFHRLDYDGAKQYSTESTKNMMSTLEGFTNALPDSTRQRAKQVVINIKSVKEEGNTAIVTFTTSEDPNKEQPPLKLVKENNKWLVQFTKADFMGGENKEPAVNITQEPPQPSSVPATDAPMTTPDTAQPKTTIRTTHTLMKAANGWPSAF